jgi:hypothetical protein
MYVVARNCTVPSQPVQLYNYPVVRPNSAGLLQLFGRLQRVQLVSHMHQAPYGGGDQRDLGSKAVAAPPRFAQRLTPPRKRVARPPPPWRGTYDGRHWLPLRYRCEGASRGQHSLDGVEDVPLFRQAAPAVPS